MIRCVQAGGLAAPLGWLPDPNRLLVFLGLEIGLEMHELVEQAVNEAYLKQDDFICAANKLGFILAKNLQEVFPKSADPETLDYLVTEYFQGLEAQGLACSRDSDQLDEDDIMEQFEDAWNKVDKSASKLQQVINNVSEWIDEPVVTQVKNPKTRKILAICYGLQEIAGKHPFYLKQAAAGNAVGIKQAAAGVKLNYLVNKKILTIVQKGHTGFSTSYFLREHPLFL